MRLPERARAAVLAWVVAVLAGVGAAGDARADGGADGGEAEGATVERARAAFKQGAALAEAARWAEALAAFERSAADRRHALTLYNVGACERALGRYTRARARLREAFARDAEATGELAPAFAEQGRAFLDELERTVARVTVTVAPPDATLAVDGRPLVPDAAGAAATADDAGAAARADRAGATAAADEVGAAAPGALVAGLAAAGPGAPPPRARFELIVDPGAHVFAIARRGFRDAVVNRTLAPGERGALSLEMDRLPAMLRVTASVDGAAVSVGGVDVGVAPVDVPRPAGIYAIAVQKPGFVAYHARMRVEAGDEARVHALMPAEQRPITKQWWFWTAAGVLVAGAAITTYAVTRPPHEPDGGGLGWVARLPPTN